MCKFMRIYLFRGCKTLETIDAEPDTLSKYQPSIMKDYNGCSCTDPNRLSLIFEYTPCDFEPTENATDRYKTECLKCKELGNILNEPPEGPGCVNHMSADLVQKLVETGCVPPSLEISKMELHQLQRRAGLKNETQHGLGIIGIESSLLTFDFDVLKDSCFE